MLRIQWRPMPAALQSGAEHEVVLSRRRDGSLEASGGTLGAPAVVGGVEVSRVLGMPAIVGGVDASNVCMGLHAGHAGHCWGRGGEGGGLVVVGRWVGWGGRGEGEMWCPGPQKTSADQAEGPCAPAQHAQQAAGGFAEQVAWVGNPSQLCPLSLARMRLHSFCICQTYNFARSPAGHAQQTAVIAPAPVVAVTPAWAQVSGDSLVAEVDGERLVANWCMHRCVSIAMR